MEQNTSTRAVASLQSSIERLLENKRYATLRDIFITLQPVDIATMFDEMPEESLPLLFRLLPKELAADTFVEMDDEAQEMLIHGFSDTELKEVVDELYVDDAVDLIEEMPANVVMRILRQADPEVRKKINEVLNYPEDSAGSIMTTEFVSLRPTMTVSDSIKRIRRTGVDKETIYTCYVIDDNRKLIGMISIKTLLLSDEDEIITEIMEPNVISVNTLDDQEQVAKKFNKYDFLAIPVVDGENRLVGIVTVDDAIDVMQEETTEDMEVMAAITPSDKPYMKTGVFETYAKRIPWLLILMISATFTGWIISSYEDALAVQVALTAFIPMLMDTGGNSGSQASVTIIRGLSLDEIKFRDMPGVIFKECRVALLCGVTLAVANFAKLMLIDQVGFYVALVVCLTLICTVLVAKIIGCTLPMIAKKIGFDPAVMASPFITTAVDAISLLMYFQIAKIFLDI
ncbi:MULTISPECIES: magnesium transporter [unclassified Ruminococcus]|uniref:magnesium transporter n=1 Tax=unclassified Ruminococcus TaxID=2608920 RepID=UPI00210E9ED7|nr:MULTISPECIES: magnesium transporter [unclassified Ruminococcus]MCQ4021450.1 magnesium transporter [Ruminococcus sp. zg-924]MCQ4113895.1 magnesium transporter [Ruminococcus sp. zg-921]